MLAGQYHQNERSEDVGWAVEDAGWAGAQNERQKMLAGQGPRMRGQTMLAG
jgi:hypothetical protein